MNMKIMTRMLIAAALSATAFIACAKSSGTLTYGDGETLEKDDSLSFSFDPLDLEEIKGEEILSEYYPSGIEATWNGKKFKVPKSYNPKVKKVDGEYEVVVKDSDDDEGNHCSLKLSVKKKTGRVSGSFKVYTLTEKENKKGKTKLKLKSYKAKVSGTLGSEDGLSVTIKGVGGTYSATLE